MRLRSIVVEDSEDDAFLLMEALRRGGYEPEFERVQTEPALRVALQKADWDVVFSDYVMPCFDAPSAYRVLVESRKGIPFIIVSGEIGEEMAVKSLKFGADDYLLKHNLKRLIPALRRALNDAENRRQRDRARHMNELIMSNSPDMICTVDGQFRFVEVSAASRRILRFAPEDMKGRKFTDFLLPEDMERTEREARGVMGGNSTSHFENRYIRRDGEVVHLAWSSWWSPADRLFFCVARDVTEQLQVERALHESETRFRLMIEQISDYAICLLDPHGCVKTWNAGAERMKGYTAAEIIGRPFSCFYTPEDLQAGRPVGLLNRARREGRAADEGWRVRKDGSRFWAHVVLTATRDSEGALSGFTKITHDLTEQKESEAQHQKMEFRLRQAQKLEAIGQLAAGIAHEINTPVQFTDHNLRFLQESFHDLTRVMNCHERLFAAAKTGNVCQALIDEVDSTTTKTEASFLLAEIPVAIGDALNGTERVAAIVRAMKDFSHPGSLKNDTPESACLNRAIESTITVARSEWRYVAEMLTDFDASIPPVPLFVGEFNQVMLNLLVNAAHAIAAAKEKNGREKGIISVSTRRDGGWAEVRVRDNGTGIPEEAQHRIFEPFFTTKEIGRGTGQGLALAHSVIADRHKGILRFETEPGVGTCFIIRLPVHRPSADEDAKPARFKK